MWKDVKILTAPRESRSTGAVGKSGPFYTTEKQKKKFPHEVFHIFTKSGGIVDDLREGKLLLFYSYRILIFAVISLMISLISGSSLTIFSTRSMEWSTVVWSRPSNSLPISFKERLVMLRI